MRDLILSVVFLIAAISSMAQKTFPDFLRGTWKVSGKETYEHWDTTEPYKLKGVGYRLKDGLPRITEFIDIVTEGQEVIYIATVPDQNKGQGIRFRLTSSGNAVFVFENPAHDYPQKISYQKISESRIKVSLGANGRKDVTYELEKILPVSKMEGNDNPEYNVSLAEKLGADDYGMKYYWLVILKTGSNTTSDKEFIADRFRGHMENIGKMVADGKLVVAGPLMKNDKNYRGIFIINHPGEQEIIKGELMADPAIKAGLLDAEIYRWYGSAALPEYLPASDKIWKKQH